MTNHSTGDPRGRLMTLPEIAEYLHTTERNVRRLTQNRLVPTVKIGRRVMAWSSDLDHFITENTRPARPEARR